MYELFIGNKNYSSWSMRPWVLMRALGIPFREHLKPFHLNHGEGSFKRFSPSGRVPVLVDGDVKVWDSLAIVEYLAERHEEVWPADARARAWARSAAAEMHSGFADLRTQCSMSVGVRVRLHHLSDELLADLRRLTELWGDGFMRHGGPFLAGRAFTAVDAFFAPVAARVQTYGLHLPRDAMSYVERLLAQPAVREWIEAGIAETFRDAAHEEEIRGHGDIVQDMRATHT
ncbi:MAG: glutathione S-transferase family protein [Pseudomonadota bacterium]|jgi:glutathione S-transferase|nr:MAG: glutathione S-transferase [Pseudomonadota bacterium]